MYTYTYIHIYIHTQATNTAILELVAKLQQAQQDCSHGGSSIKTDPDMAERVAAIKKKLSAAKAAGAWVYVCIYIYMHVCIYIYIYIYI